MRAVRFLTFALLLVVGVAGKASAQYNNTPGTYTDVKVGIVPAALPPGSLPSDIGKLGPDLYTGTLTVTQNGTYTVQYKGETEDGAKVIVNASFTSEWLGWKTGFLVVGSSMEEVITGIDAIHLISANINGVGTVDDSLQRVIAKFTGTGSYPPDLTSFRALPAPGNLR